MFFKSISVVVMMLASVFGQSIVIDSVDTLRAVEERYRLNPSQEDVALALVDVYLFGPKMYQNHDQAARILKDLVARENPEAIELLAGMHLNGRGVLPDEGEAFRLYTQGAFLGDGPSQFNLGILYMHKIKQTLKEYPSVQKLFILDDDRTLYTHIPNHQGLSTLSSHERHAYDVVRAYARLGYYVLQGAFLREKDLGTLAQDAASFRNRLCPFLTKTDIDALNERLVCREQTNRQMP